MSNYGTINIDADASSGDALTFTFGSVQDIGFSTTSEDTDISDVVYSDDGGKMFVLGRIGDDINEYTLSTAFDPTSASFVDSFSVSTQDIVPNGLAANLDGTKFYIAGSNGNTIEEYDLSTGWDISTASHNQSFDISGSNTDPKGLKFSPDGQYFYVNNSGTGECEQWYMTTPWDISTASILNSFDYTGQITAANAWGVDFNNDGSLLFITDNSSHTIEVFTVSTAWDLSSEVLHVQAFDVSGMGNSPRGLSWGNGGLNLAIAGDGSTRIHSVQCPNEYRLQDKLSRGNNFSLSTQCTAPYQVYNRPAGDYNQREVYVTDDAGASSEVVKYTMDDFNGVASASSNYSIASQTTNPVGISFSLDGLRFYVTSGIVIYEYAMSREWDLSSASYTDSYTDATNMTDIGGLSWEPDGSGFIVADNRSGSAAAIVQYSCSTAWDVSTASYVRALDVSGREQSPADVKFGEDGTRMFLTGYQADKFHEYVLSTAYDISTATILQDMTMGGITPASYACGFDFDVATGDILFINGAGNALERFTR